MSHAGRYVLVRCHQCDELFPVSIFAYKKAKWCPECKTERQHQRDLVRDYGEEKARKAQRKRAATEREARQICRARRDLQWNALHTPVTVIRLGGMRIERRGTVPAGGRAVSVVSHNA